MDRDALERFHNGDTLDDIPVIRLPQRRRIEWSKVALIGAGTLVASAMVGSLVMPRHSPPPRPVAEASSPAPVAGSPTPSPTPSIWTESPTPDPTTQWPATVAAPDNPTPSTEVVHVVSVPDAEGDAGTPQCITFTGNGDASGRDGTLHSVSISPGDGGFPVSGCSALLVNYLTGQVSGPGSYAIVAQLPPSCMKGTPAILDYSRMGGGSPEDYTCLAPVGGQ